MKDKNFPQIGILCWEAGTVPRGIAQISELKGSSVNPESYDYPVDIVRVKGANAQTIVINPDEDVLNSMVEEMKAMVSRGVTAIATSCGFNAIHQRRLADAVDVPVFSSSIMQIPFIKPMLRSDQAVGVLTARKKSLTTDHLINAGVGKDIPLHIMGMENFPEWSRLLDSSDVELDLKLVKEEIASAGIKAMKDHPDIGAFVLECTDMPPFADAVKEATGLPVFDFITMADYVHQAL